MKKVGFIAQVLTLTIALPLLTILELNHANARTAAKKTGSFVIAPVEKNTGTLEAAVRGKMPS